MKPVIKSGVVAIVAFALCPLAAMADAKVAERSFGTPVMTLVKEAEMNGRQVLRYEHESVPEWGYAKKQTYYFYLLPLDP